ncbi:hypothetical protein M3650_23685 [Paenibacillus sp. MER TA 81-3]|uniref:hypothetical protein n=1 Tax=Paenibacillus sp. MER TA 81-3 TaxID=2939573 RepID=UPI0020418B70|nr:hypothetical protein [Paenibacillus sp. MER TA 81-3]MCM3341559.1 hypothetical protein [Paenibacillus sp. MER TA 81-3]
MPHTLFNREEWANQLDGGEYFVIAHLLSQVLIGREHDHRKALQEAMDENALLEAHFFNKDKEIFISQLERQLAMYEPLEHDHAVSDEWKIIRSYKLDQSIVNQKRDNAEEVKVYKAVEVIEYMKHDTDSHLAYVDKTVLYRLTEE